MELSFLLPLLISLLIICAIIIWASTPERRFKKKVWADKIDYAQLIYTVIITPGLLAIGFWAILETLNQPYVRILPLSDHLLLFLIFITSMMAAIGQGAHLVSKCLSWHLKNQKDTPAYLANCFFHKKFSHSLVYYFGLLAYLMFPLTEINHPPQILIPVFFRFLLVGFGVITGLAVATVLNDTASEGFSYQKLNTFFISSSAFLLILITNNFTLYLYSLPWTLFTISSLITASFLSIGLNFPKIKKFFTRKLTLPKNKVFLAEVKIKS